MNFRTSQQNFFYIFQIKWLENDKIWIVIATNDFFLK